MGKNMLQRGIEQKIMKLISTQKHLHYIDLYAMAMSICVTQSNPTQININ